MELLVVTVGEVIVEKTPIWDASSDDGFKAARA